MHGRGRACRRVRAGRCHRHPDHRAATAVAHRFAADRGLPLLEWGLSPGVAAPLRVELGVPFVALVEGPGADLLEVELDRGRQLAAIACHRSQATGNAALARRLALQGPIERVCYRTAPVAATTSG